MNFEDWFATYFPDLDLSKIPVSTHNQYKAAWESGYETGFLEARGVTK